MIAVCQHCINYHTKKAMNEDECKCQCRVMWLTTTTEIMIFNLNLELHTTVLQCENCKHYTYIDHIRQMTQLHIVNMPANTES